MPPPPDQIGLKRPTLKNVYAKKYPLLAYLRCAMKKDLLLKILRNKRSTFQNFYVGENTYTILLN